MVHVETVGFNRKARTLRHNNTIWIKHFSEHLGGFFTRQNTIQIASLVMCLNLILSGCATMMTGKTQEVTITSNPPGAIVKINDKEHKATIKELQTPAKVSLSKKSSYIAVIEKPGYESAVVEIGRVASLWNFLDVVWIYFIPVPLIYDADSTH